MYRLYRLYRDPKGLGIRFGLEGLTHQIITFGVRWGTPGGTISLTRLSDPLRGRRIKCRSIGLALPLPEAAGAFFLILFRLLFSELLRRRIFTCLILFQSSGLTLSLPAAAGAFSPMILCVYFLRPCCLSKPLHMRSLEPLV